MAVDRRHLQRGFLDSERAGFVAADVRMTGAAHRPLPLRGGEVERGETEPGEG